MGPPIAIIWPVTPKRSPAVLHRLHLAVCAPSHICPKTWKDDCHWAAFSPDHGDMLAGLVCIQQVAYKVVSIVSELSLYPQLFSSIYQKLKHVGQKGEVSLLLWAHHFLHGHKFKSDVIIWVILLKWFLRPTSSHIVVYRAAVGLEATLDTVPRARSHLLRLCCSAGARKSQQCLSLCDPWRPSSERCRAPPGPVRG